jgi:hypothetical protein
MDSIRFHPIIRSGHMRRTAFCAVQVSNPLKKKRVPNLVGYPQRHEDTKSLFAFESLRLCVFV